MFDKILQFGAGFDWISPLWTLFQDHYHGSAFQIHVPYGAGWSGGTIERALRQKGIIVWGEMVVDDVILFTVKEEQARYALYWLERWGVPVESHSPLAEISTHRRKQISSSSSDSETDNLFDRTLDTIGKWIG